MRVVDNVILADLRTIPGVNIHDGVVVVDKTTNTVILPLPLANYRSTIGDDDNRRLGGKRMRRSVFFDLTIYGVSRDQVKAAGEKIRNRLEQRRFVIPGHRSWRCEVQVSTRIFRDDDAVRPDGTPTFYCVDSYDISILKQGSTP